MAKLAVVILAAGQGTRMKSKTQKILHEVGGRPMVAHVFYAAQKVADLPPLLVVAPGEEGLHALFADQAIYVEQAQQLGTGHATMMASGVLEGRSDQVLVTYADMPLLRTETMNRLARRQAETAASVALLTGAGSPDSSFGRVLRDEDGRVVEIVEVAEAQQRPDKAALLAIDELNVGVYCFAAGWLWRNLPGLPLRQARSGQEYYLTDMIGLAVSQAQKVETVALDDPDECLGAGTRAELVKVEKAFRRRVNAYWLNNGVTFIEPDTIYVDPEVTIGQDTILWPNTYLLGHTAVGQDCVIGPNTIIREAVIGDGCRIETAVIEHTTIHDNSHIPPFSHMTGRRKA